MQSNNTLKMLEGLDFFRRMDELTGAIEIIEQAGYRVAYSYTSPAPPTGYAFISIIIIKNENWLEYIRPGNEEFRNAITYSVNQPVNPLDSDAFFTNVFLEFLKLENVGYIGVPENVN